MYIKKSVLVICSIILVLASALLTIMAVNPFGIIQFDDFFKFNTGVGALKKYFYEDIDNETLVDGALLGLSYSAEDPYTVYMDREEAKTFMENVESDDYIGIGLYLTNNIEDNTITVVSPLAHSPAEDAGIVSGDKIVEVEGKAVKGEDLNEVAAKLRGEDETFVKIKVMKKNSGETEEINLTRRTIKRETVNSKFVEDKTGYIQITQFGVNTYVEFVEHYNNLIDEGMRKLVIDVRNNPGGYVETASQVADVFLSEGTIVYTMNKYGQKHEYIAQSEKVQIPLVILTNGGTASASEILVGALRDWGIAESVGEKTFGKGVTQVPYQLYDGSILKITDSRYYTPKGVCIDKEGIVPDYEIEMSDEKTANISELSLNEDDQLKKAIEVLKSK